MPPVTLLTPPLTLTVTLTPLCVLSCDKEVGCIEQAHDSLIWSMSWHPLGHVLASGSNDHTTKFWTRNRPGDTMQDKYNLNVFDGAETGPAPPAARRTSTSEDATAQPGLYTLIPPPLLPQYLLPA